jgi:hypothetical protein
MKAGVRILALGIGFKLQTWLRVDGDIRIWYKFLDYTLNFFCKTVGVFQGLITIHQDMDIHKELRA